MADLIDRQAAIAVVSKWFRQVYGIDERDRVFTVFKHLLDLPAVEIIRCHECEHYNDSSVEDRKMCFRKDVDGWKVCYDFAPNDFCSYGERRTK